MLNAIQLRELASPVSPFGHLSQTLRDRLHQWVSERPRPPGSDLLAHEMVSAVVAIYDDALAQLSGKTGERADAARAQISAARAPLAAGLELVDALQANFGGVLAVELQKRITSTRAALASALAAKEVATRSTIDAAVLEVERCLADIRELDRDLGSIREGLIVPWKSPYRALWPDIEDLRSAAQSTRALEQQRAKSPRAAEVHAAIEQGIKAPTHVAVLWIAYETKSDHELLVWRWRAFAERG